MTAYMCTTSNRGHIDLKKLLNCGHVRYRLHEWAAHITQYSCQRMLDSPEGAAEVMRLLDSRLISDPMGALQAACLCLKHQAGEQTQPAAVTLATQLPGRFSREAGEPLPILLADDPAAASQDPPGRILTGGAISPSIPDAVPQGSGHACHGHGSQSEHPSVVASTLARLSGLEPAPEKLLAGDKGLKGLTGAVPASLEPATGAPTATSPTQPTSHASNQPQLGGMQNGPAHHTDAETESQREAAAAAGDASQPFNHAGVGAQPYSLQDNPAHRNDGNAQSQEKAAAAGMMLPSCSNEDWALRQAAQKGQQEPASGTNFESPFTIINSMEGHRSMHASDDGHSQQQQPAFPAHSIVSASSSGLHNHAEEEEAPGINSGNSHLPNGPPTPEKLAPRIQPVAQQSLKVSEDAEDAVSDSAASERMTGGNFSTAPAAEAVVHPVAQPSSELLKSKDDVRMRSAAAELLPGVEMPSASSSPATTGSPWHEPSACGSRAHNVSASASCLAGEAACSGDSQTALGWMVEHPIGPIHPEWWIPIAGSTLAHAVQQSAALSAAGRSAKGEHFSFLRKQGVKTPYPRMRSCEPIQGELAQT